MLQFLVYRRLKDHYLLVCLFFTGVKTYYNAHFGPGSGPIFLSNLNCIGNEDNLLECSRYSCNVQSCSHSNDAGVFCECE